MAGSSLCAVSAQSPAKSLYVRIMSSCHWRLREEAPGNQSPSATSMRFFYEMKQICKNRRRDYVKIGFKFWSGPIVHFGDEFLDSLVCIARES